MNEDTNEALNNLISSIKEKMNESNNAKSGDTIEKSSESDNLNVSINNSTNNEKNNNSDKSSNSTFDPELFFKIQKIMSAMNSNNPKKNLLLSLKPFLRQTRQDKISEYINILNIISALDTFRKGRD